jgi:hypothetical protein
MACRENKINIMNNINTIKKYLSTNSIYFLNNLNKSIDINKSGKSYYFKIFRIELDDITNFIDNLDDSEIYLVNPIISINCKSIDPYITLSNQFLISNRSNPILINNSLIDQLGIVRNNFQFQDDYYYLIFEYQSITLKI